MVQSQQPRPSLKASSSTSSHILAEHRERRAAIQMQRSKRRRLDLVSKRRKLSACDADSARHAIVAGANDDGDGHENARSGSADVSRDGMLTVEQFVELVQGLKEPAAEQRPLLLRKLRRFLSLSAAADEDSVGIEPEWSQYPIDAELVDLLGTHLRVANEESQLEATWCLTNLASGSHTIASMVMSHAALLIQYLRSSDTILCEQCCWCLGNLAADCVSFRTTLIKMGIVHPLVDILQSTRIASLRETGLWCLLNLVRGTGDMYEVLVTESNVVTCVMQLFISAVDEYHADSSSGGGSGGGGDAAGDQGVAIQRNILAELAWILVHLTSTPHDRIFQPVASQLENPTFVSRLLALVSSRGPQIAGNHHGGGQAVEEGNAILSPALRILGNLLRSDRFEQHIMLNQQTASQLHSRLQQLLQIYIQERTVAACSTDEDHTAVVQRELLWLLGNMFGSSNEAIVQSLLERGFHEFVLQLVTRRTVDIALKQEALFIVTNICASGIRVEQIIVHDRESRVLRFLNDLCAVAAQQRDTLIQALRFIKFLCKLYESADHRNHNNPMAAKMRQIGLHGTLQQIIDKQVEFQLKSVGKEDEVDRLARQILASHLGCDD